MSSAAARPPITVKERIIFDTIKASGKPMSRKDVVWWNGVYGSVGTNGAISALVRKGYAQTDGEPGPDSLVWAVGGS